MMLTSFVHLGWQKCCVGKGFFFSVFESSDLQILHLFDQSVILLH